MRRLAALGLAVVVSGLTTAGLAAPARADDSPSKSSSDDDAFETSWFGLRPEFWYAPTLGLQAQVGGKQGASSTIGGSGGETLAIPTRFDANKDLGVADHTPQMTGVPEVPGTLGLEMFADTRWVSLSFWGFAPFSYHGHTSISESYTIDGFTFSATRPVETTLEQALAGFDIEVNIINNRFVRLSPVVACRALAIDWSIKDTGIPPIPGASVSTNDVKLPISAGRFQVLPYPEVGGEVRAGYRDIVEADVKLTGMYVNFFGYAATTALADAGITGYIPFLPQIGLRLGYRYYYLHARTTDEKVTHSLDMQMRLSGFNFSAIVRF